MIELELQYSAIEALDTNENDRLKKVKNGALKTLEHGLLTIYDEVIYIHRSTTDKLKIKRGKEPELNSCYLRTISTPGSFVYFGGQGRNRPGRQDI
jgi:hypothetical protein